MLYKENLLRLIGNIADNMNLPCYVVGGYVRDSFLNLNSDDIDIVVEGSGTNLAEVFADFVGSKVDTYETYGTAKVDYLDTKIEFVGARSESYPRSDSRNPIVKPGTLLEDLSRRDFTINSMAICINENNFGNLVDPFSGLDHLKQGVLVTPIEPGKTFSDDPLRMLRCIRFSTKFNFWIEEKTLEGIKENSTRLKIISKERIITEFFKILSYPNCSSGIKLLQMTGLLQEFLPELSVLDTVDDGRHKNNFFHSVEVLRNISKVTDNVWLRFATLLHDIGKDKCKRKDDVTGNWTFYGHPEVGAKMIPIIGKRLRLPNDKIKYLEKIVRLHMRPQKIAEDGITDSAVRRFLVEADDDVEDLLLLSKCDVTTKHFERKLELQKAIDFLEIKIEDLKERDWRREFQPCVNGFDIMEMFNLKKGALVGELKEAMKNEILDGNLKNEREDLINYLKNLYNNNYK